MNREVIATGATIEEAQEEARRLLGADEEANVEYEIIDLPVKKTLGLFGGSPAKVKATIQVSPAEDAVEYLTKIFREMGVEGVTLTVKEMEGGAEITADGEDIGLIIGRRGETLDALQYLVSLYINRSKEGFFRILLNVGNYREKRESTLQGLARRAAINAARTGRSTTLEPMSPYERRIIHTAVQNVRGATSWSVGEEPNRCVVIGSERRGKGGFRGDRKPRAPRQEKAPVPSAEAPAEERKVDETAVPLYGRIDV